MQSTRILVVGAGMGGMAAAVRLAATGLDVTVLEKEPTPGGKMRQVGGVDAGPTVLTMRWVFDELFAEAGARLEDHVTLRPAEILARHAWQDGTRLDLFGEIDRSADAIGDFAGGRAAAGYRAFCARARDIYETLAQSFIHAARPNPVSLGHRVGLSGLGALWRISPFTTLWDALGEYFQDPRLRQLFGRYATYCGSSPFAAPATLMLVAHVERAGVWLPEGGMQRIATALAHLATLHGATIHYDCEVRALVTDGRGVTGVTLANGEHVDADAVVLNADVAAIAEGLFGHDVAAAAPRIARHERSLSAVTWTMRAHSGGFPLVRHNVFFSDDYAAEFDDVFARRRLPASPTVYICAQDRDDDDARDPGVERLLCLVNAPPDGDINDFATEIAPCASRTFALLERCGLSIRPQAAVTTTTPADFKRMFPGTGGALYGMASHGWMASFRRPGARTRIPGLYLAGGSCHPGPGVPMAALSGKLAAASLLEDLASTHRSHRAVTPGGMSTRSATTGRMRSR
jgi:1-hydroxycarotenoid 3,4-desaturase